MEGDLGVYVNMRNVVELITERELSKRLDISEDELDTLIQNHTPIPQTDEQIRFVEELTKVACYTALERHAGQFIELFSTAGKKRIAQGKDLTAIKYIVGTGGALTKLKNRVKILEGIYDLNKGLKLMPKDTAKIVIDNHYIMASLGVLSKKYKQESIELLKQSLKIK